MPFVAVIEAEPEKLGDEVVAAAGERGRTGRDRVRPGGEGLAVERESARRYRERDRDVARDGRGVVVPVAADAQAAFGRAVEGETAVAVDAVTECFRKSTTGWTRGRKGRRTRPDGHTVGIHNSRNSRAERGSRKLLIVALAHEAVRLPEAATRDA